MKKSCLSYALIASAAVTCAAQTADRNKPPVSPDPRPYKLPAIFETKLPNGLTVMMAEDKRVPLATVRLVFPGGNRRDPKDIPGLAASTASMLTQGTKTRTYQQIAEQLDSMGAAMSAAAGADQITIQGSVLSDKLPVLLDLIADVARNASFPENELALHKQNRKQQLAMQHAEPSFLAAEAFRKATFEGHPYQHIGPTSESLDKVDQKTVAGFRDTFLVPNNGTLIIVGNLPARAAAIKTITSLFGTWEQKEVPKYEPGPVPAAKKQMLFVNRPGSVQADIAIGRTAAVRRDADYFPEVVGSVILGSGTNSRLFTDIREKRGYAYDAHTELNPLDNAATMQAITQIRNEVAPEGIAAVMEHLDNMAKTPVSGEELRSAKSFANGMFLMRLEPQAGLADQLVTMRVQGLPKDYLESYTTKVNSVEPDQIQNIAKKYFSTENASIVVVGDAEKLQKPLEEKLGKFTVVKPGQ